VTVGLFQNCAAAVRIHFSFFLVKVGMQCDTFRVYVYSSTVIHKVYIRFWKVFLKTQDFTKR